MGPMWLVIVGAGGHGIELWSYTQNLLVAVEEIDLPGSSEILGDLAVLAGLAASHPTEIVHYLTAVGNNCGPVSRWLRSRSSGGLS